MASRAELIQIADELEVKEIIENMTIEEMTEELKQQIDKKYNKKYPISPDDLSDTILKFMVEEYDYVLMDEEGNYFDQNEEPYERDW